MLFNPAETSSSIPIFCQSAQGPTGTSPVVAQSHKSGLWVDSNDVQKMRLTSVLLAPCVTNQPGGPEIRVIKPWVTAVLKSFLLATGSNLEDIRLLSTLS